MLCPPTFLPPSSRLFLYYNARLLNGKRAGNGLMADAGSSLRACCKAVSHFGVAPEQLWPYQERMVAVQPPQGGLVSRLMPSTRGALSIAALVLPHFSARVRCCNPSAVKTSLPPPIPSDVSAEAYEAAKRYKGRFLYRKVPQDVYCLMAALRQGLPIVCGL